MSVRSAIRVAGVVRQLQPDQLNRATLIALAQSTDELDDVRLSVNGKGVQKEIQTFVGALQQQGAAPQAVNALSAEGDRMAFAARAKKAVACLLWMRGTPSAQLEQTIMKHYFDRNAIGPIRAVAARTHDVIETVMGIAAELRPSPSLEQLATLLPAQLQLGISADHVPLALAGAQLLREHYLNLAAIGLTTMDLIDQADDKVLLKCAGDPSLLLSLKEALNKHKSEASAPSLHELLSEPTD